MSVTFSQIHFEAQAFLIDYVGIVGYRLSLSCAYQGHESDADVGVGILVVRFSFAPALSFTHALAFFYFFDYLI